MPERPSQWGLAPLPCTAHTFRTHIESLKFQLPLHPPTLPHFLAQADLQRARECIVLTSDLHLTFLCVSPTDDLIPDWRRLLQLVNSLQACRRSNLLERLAFGHFLPSLRHLMAWSKPITAPTGGQSGPSPSWSLPAEAPCTLACRSSTSGQQAQLPIPALRAGRRRKRGLTRRLEPGSHHGTCAWISPGESGWSLG